MDKEQQIKERIEEVKFYSDMDDEVIYLLDGCEGGLIGTMLDSNLKRVAVYERNLCIKSLMESLRPMMYEDYMGYTEEQKQDKDFMEQELYMETVQHFEKNVEMTCRYNGNNPIVIDAFECDSEIWEKF